MAHRFKLVVAALALLGASQASAYVSPSPPPGFGGSPGSWTFTPPSAAQQLGNIMRGPGPSIAGAGGTSAAFRLGAGAARALAGASLLGGVALGVAWLAENCFEKQGGQWVRTCGFSNPPPQSDGYEYRVDATTTYHATPQLACANAGPELKAANGYATVTNLTYHPAVPPATDQCGFDWTAPPYGGHSEFYIRKRETTCPVGWYITPAGCVQNLPPQTVTQQEIEDEMATKPLPQTLPPGIPYPLETLPSIWNPTEENPPASKPLRVPTGNPRPVPNTNPQQYQQPVTRWTHSPTVSDPWRMDVQPETLTSESPTGLQEPTSVTSGSPTGTEPEKFDLCKEHPDIVACQKLGELKPDAVPNTERTLAITPDSGWGPSTGTCPAPKNVSLVSGPSLSFSYDPFCQVANGIRPVVIALAWFLAACSFIGLGRRGD